MCASCTWLNTADKNKLARVGKEILYTADVVKLLPDNYNQADSIQFVHDYADTWISDKVFIAEARKSIKEDSIMKAFIEDYRNSLSINFYEQKLLNGKLDSVIDHDELLRYYEQNKSQYILNSSILRLNLIIIDQKKHTEIAQIQELWDSTDSLDHQELRKLAQKSARTYLLDDSTWYKKDFIEPLLPEGFMESNNLSKVKNYRLAADSSTYFFRVLEQLPDAVVAPLSYVERQAKKVILYERQRALINRKRKELVTEALSWYGAEKNY